MLYFVEFVKSFILETHTEPLTVRLQPSSSWQSRSKYETTLLGSVPIDSVASSNCKEQMIRQVSPNWLKTAQQYTNSANKRDRMPQIIKSEMCHKQILFPRSQPQFNFVSTFWQLHKYTVKVIKISVGFKVAVFFWGIILNLLHLCSQIHHRYDKSWHFKQMFSIWLHWTQCVPSLVTVFNPRV